MFWRSAFFCEDRDFGFEVGRLNVRDQTPFEPGMKTFFEGRDFAGGQSAENDDLLVGVVECIESVKELFLRSFLAGDELDIVDEQNIVIAVTLSETEQLVVTDGADQVVGELLAWRYRLSASFCSGV